MINERQSQPATSVFGEGIDLGDLAILFKVIRERNLTLQIKIGDNPWENLSPVIIIKMIKTISQGNIKEKTDIQLRLFASAVGNSCRT